MDMKSKTKDEMTLNKNEESKIIAEFHISPMANTIEQMLEDYHTCCLCGSSLDFTHVTHFVTQEVTEEAFCTSCNIRSKEDVHRLQ